MRKIGTFKSKRWGQVGVWAGTYGSADGPLAIQLQEETTGAPVATLSVNMYKPQCSADSRDLPRNCFYMKGWSENRWIAAEAKECGLFAWRNDLPTAYSGYVSADAFEVVGMEA